MDFNAYPKTIYDLFSVNKSYIVPRFQREYSWEKEQVSELWSDILGSIRVENNKIINEEYFIGSLVLVGSDNSEKASIVDGQQRLTTITILLSALAETLKNTNNEDLAIGISDNFIIRTDVDNKKVFRLQNETPKPFFQTSIQNFEKIVEDPKSEEEEKLLNSYKFFCEALTYNNLKSSLKHNPELLSILVNPDGYIEILKSIRTQILNLKTIYISVANEDEAYIIFETLNARGINLSTTDLIKNEIFKQLNTEHPDDFAKSKWNKIKEELNSREYGVNLDTFFRHYWLSNYKPATTSKIYKKFKEMVVSHNLNIEDFLDDLVLNAEYYTLITNPLINDWPMQEEKEIFYSLEALNIFRVKQVRILLLSLIRLRREKKLSLKDFKEILKILEDFHFVFTAVVSSRPSGLDGKYSSYARQFAECNNPHDTKKLIIKLKKDLNEKLPSKITFLEKISNIKYSKTETKHRKLIYYIFRRLEQHHLGNDEMTVSNITIEHILPQSSKNIRSLELGNLLPLARDINNNAGNRTFSQKLELYKGSNLKTVETFLDEYSDESEWTDFEISKRTLKISELLYDEILNI